MPFPVPEPWTRDSADIRREEKKRKESPYSFFYSQGQSLRLAAEYFHDGRLADDARGGWAIKHRHRIHLALFGQLMASFEYLLKDFVTQAIDTTAMLDDAVQQAKWVQVDAGKVLANRLAASTPGAMLVHSTTGGHNPEIVNSRYQELFSRMPIATDEKPTLEKLWVLRHSVAHNAGFVTHYDSSRVGSSDLAEKVVNIDDAFIRIAFDTLKPIASRVATDVGDGYLLSWLRTVKPSGGDFDRDKDTYVSLKKLATLVESRDKDLPTFAKSDYQTDLGRA